MRSVSFILDGELKNVFISPDSFYLTEQIQISDKIEAGDDRFFVETK